MKKLTDASEKAALRNMKRAGHPHLDKAPDGRLADIEVALQLGWMRKFENGCGYAIYYRRFECYEDENGWRNLPAYTTSLDAIVAEIEARELQFGLSSLNVGGYMATIYNGKFEGKGDTPPLALCAALLKYLKENPNAK